MAREHLLLQAYGRDDIRDQALYAASSALAWKKDLDLVVHVYADDAAFLAPLGEHVRVRLVSPEEIRAWRGPHDCAFRMKAAVVRDLAREIGSERLLYLDSDVFFTAPARDVFDRIGPGRAVMHVREFDIANHPTGQLRRYRRRMRRATFRGRPVTLDGAMWNAGAIGLDPTHFPILDEWIAMIDALWDQVSYWMHEQFAISKLLAREGAIAPANDAIVHYWIQKDDALARIRPRLELLRSTPLDTALRRLREDPILLPPPVRRRSTLRERIARVLRKLG
jgi:hypothetical protein